LYQGSIRAESGDERPRAQSARTAAAAMYLGTACTSDTKYRASRDSKAPVIHAASAEITQTTAIEPVVVMMATKACSEALSKSEVAAPAVMPAIMPSAAPSPTLLARGRYKGGTADTTALSVRMRRPSVIWPASRTPKVASRTIPT